MQTNIKQRIANAIDAFFDDEISTENNSLTFSNENGLSEKQISHSFFEKADIFIKFLKQVFLFFPGVFVLFNLSLILVVFTLNPPLGAKMFYPERLVLTLIVSAFITMFGLGDIKNIKHLVIPVSVILLASIVGIFAALLSADRYGVILIDKYGIYLFPLALVTPVLAKGWIDGKWKDFD